MGTLRNIIMVAVVVLIFMGSCGKDNQISPIDTVPPNPPVGISADPEGGDLVLISWDQNAEPDLAGYKLYRSYNQNGPFGPVTSRTLQCPWYSAHVTPMDLTYFKVTAVDRSGNESAYSQIVAIYLNPGKHDGQSTPIEHH
jgi:hypothetical protein